MPPCRQAGTRAGRDAGGRARMPARRQEGVPAIPTAKERDFRRTYVPLPLRGSIWRQCGSLWRSSAARTAGPGSVLLLGSRRVSGDRYPVKSGMTGLPQSVCYGFLCPLRHSKVSFELLKGFRVTPETTLPLAGRGFLSEVGKPVFLPAVRLPEAALRP